MAEEKKQKGGKHNYTPEQEALYDQFCVVERQQQEITLNQLQAKESAKTINDQEKKDLKNIRAIFKDEIKRETDNKAIEDLESRKESLGKEEQVELAKMLKKKKVDDTKRNNLKNQKIRELLAKQEKGEDLNLTLQPEQQQQLKDLKEKQQTKQKESQQQQQKNKESQQSVVEISNKQSKDQDQLNSENSKKQVHFDGQKQNSIQLQPKKGILKEKVQMVMDKRRASLLPDHLKAPLFNRSKSLQVQENSESNTQKLESRNIHKKDIHYSVLELGLKISNDKIIGSNKRCIEYLNAVCKVIQDIDVNSNENNDGNNNDNEELSNKQQQRIFDDKLQTCLDKIQEQMKTFRSINEGMKTAYNFCNTLRKLLAGSRRDEKRQNIQVQTEKDWICEQIYNFIDIKILKADQQIIKFGQEIVKDGDYILVYARSLVIEQLLIKCHQQGINFTVVVVDNAPFHEGKQLVENLSKYGLDCMYTLLSHAAYFMKKVTKVFVGASAMLSNGALVSRVGTALISCIAKDYRKPLHVLCESYKFSEKNYLDSLSWNEIADNFKINSKNTGLKQQPKNEELQQQQTQKGKKQQLLQQQQQCEITPINLRYDVTPCENINMLITEYGKVPPHSVPHIIREFSKYDQVGRIELPMAQPQPQLQ